MAKTLMLAEKDEETYFKSVGEYLEGGLPESYRDFVIAHREEGYSAVYSAYMVRLVQEMVWERVGRLNDLIAKGRQMHRDIDDALGR